MVRSRVLCYGILLSTFLLIGCSEENITNNIIESPGSIFGRVMPVESGTEVSAWQGTKIKSVFADNEGFFAITELEPGLYNIVVEAPSGARRELRGVELIDAGVSLGIVQISSLPSPLLGHLPGAGATGATPVETSIELLADTRLSLRSLAASVTVTPPLEGEWVEQVVDGAYSYRFLPLRGLSSSTTYTVAVGDGLTLPSGETWGETLSYSFTTDVLRIDSVLWGAGSTTNVAPQGGDLVEITFNTNIDFTAVDQAIEIEPPAELSISRPYEEPSDNTIRVQTWNALASGTDYQITIGSGIQDYGGNALVEERRLDFTTAPLAVVSTRWRGGQPPVSPRISGELVSLTFNTLLDASTVASAVRLVPDADILVQYNSNSGGVRVSVAGGLPSGTSFQLIVDPTIRDLWGGALPAAHTVDFVTEPIRIASVQWTGTPNSIPPRLSGRLALLNMNAYLDPGSVGDAFTIDPEVDFTASLSGYSTPNYQVEIQLAGTLSPSSQYTLSLSGELRDIFGQTLTGTSMTFETEGLRVVSSDFRGSNSQVPIEPGDELVASLELNSRVDLTAFNAAASFTPAIGGTWFERDDYSGIKMIFFPDGGWEMIPDQDYTFQLDGAAPLIDGQSLGRSYVRSFNIAPVRIRSFSPSNGSTDVPLTFPRVQAVFNIEMDQAATEAAFTLETLEGIEADGTFSWPSYEQGRRMEFRPTSLDPGETYRIRITTDAVSSSGHALKEAWESVFRCRDS